MPSTFPALLVKSHRWIDQWLVQNQLGSDTARMKSQVCLTSGFKLWALGQTALFVQTALCSQKPLLRRHLQSHRASDWALASDTREMSATCRRGPLEASTVTFPCDFPSVLPADGHRLDRVLKTVERRSLQIRNTVLVWTWLSQRQSSNYINALRVGGLPVSANSVPSCLKKLRV